MTDTNNNASTFAAVSSDQIPPGCCLIMDGLDLMYFGPIVRSTPVPGCVMYLHPIDMEILASEMPTRQGH